MARPLVKYFVAIFAGLALIRLAFGQPLDRHFLIWFAVFVVVMLLVGLFLFGLPVVTNDKFFSAMRRRIGHRRE